MGCSCIKQVLKITEKNKPFYDAYLSIKNVLYNIINDEETILEVFLINTDSIFNFIRCIKKSKVLNELEKENNESFESLNNLLNMFDDYDLENNIEIYYDYEKCQNFLSKW